MGFYEQIGELYIKMIDEARDRAKKLGAQSDEDTIYILEREVRQYRDSVQGISETLKEREAEKIELREALDAQKKLTENTRNKYEDIADRLTKEIHRQRIMLDEAWGKCGTVELVKEDRATDINLNINITYNGCMEGH